jgi:SNF2 family DNA or RNA helicase
LPVAELDDSGSKIIVTTQYSDQFLIKQVPGASWSDRANGHVMPATWAGCLILRELFGARLEVGPALAEKSQQWKLAADWRNHLAPRMVPAGTDAAWLRPVDAELEKLPGTLYPFQAAGAEWLSLLDASALFDEQGTGKTVQAIAHMKALDALGVPVRPALIIAPASVMGSWEAEFAKWIPEWAVRQVTGGAARRREILSQLADVFIVSWQSLRFHTRLAPYGSIRLKRCAACGGERVPGDPSAITEELVRKHLAPGDSLVSASECEVHLKELNTIPLRLVIADEAHRLANEKSKQTRAAWHVMHSAPRRVAMTGTPTGESIDQLWSILHALDPAAFPARSAYLDLFAATSRDFYGGFEVLGIKAEHRELFHAVTSPYIRRMLKSAVLPQLPDKMPVSYRYPAMKPQQARTYRQMKDDMIAQLDELVVAPNPMVQVGRLSMFASASAEVTSTPCETCGGTGQWRDRFHPEAFLETCTECKGMGKIQVINLIEASNKVDDLIEFMSDEGDRPLVVCAVHKDLIYLACQRLVREHISFVVMTGDTPQAERDTLKATFQAGTVRVFLFTLGTGSEGITLTRSDTIFYMEHDWSYRVNSQADDRVHRIGSEIHASIRTIVQVTPGTVDERKEEVLAGRAGKIEEVIRDKERLRWLIAG